MMQFCAAALAAKHGVKIVCSDAEAFRSQFYSFRAGQRRRGNTSLDVLLVHLVSESEVWLLRDENQHRRPGVAGRAQDL